MKNFFPKLTYHTLHEERTWKPAVTIVVSKNKISKLLHFTLYEVYVLYVLDMLLWFEANVCTLTHTYTYVSYGHWSKKLKTFL